MRMILGNSIEGRGAAIERPGIPMHQPRDENRATGRFGAFPSIPPRTPTTVFRPPPHHTRNPRGFPLGPDRLVEPQKQKPPRG